jgi:hypothetical protein
MALSELPQPLLTAFGTVIDEPGSVRGCRSKYPFFVTNDRLF